MSDDPKSGIHLGQGKQAGLLVAGGLATATAGRVLILVIAGIMLDPDDLGRFVLWQSIVTLAAEIGRWGIPRASLFLLSPLKNAGQPEQRRSGLDPSASFRNRDMVLASLPPALAASAVTAICCSVFFGSSTNGLSPIVVGLLTFVWVFGEAVRLPASESFRASGHVVKATVLGDGGRIVLATLILGVASTLTQGLGTVVASISVASLLVAIVASRAAWTFSKTSAAGLTEGLAVTGVLRAGTPLLTIGLTGVAQRQVLILIAASTLSLADTGRFTLLLRASMLVGLVLHGLVAFVSPAVANTELPRQAGQLSRRLGALTKRATSIAIGMGLTLFVMIPPAVRHLSMEGAFGLRLPLAILILGQVVNVATGPGGQVLVLHGYERLVQRIALLGFILVVILGVGATPYFNLNGLAAAFALAVVFRNMVTASVCRRKTGIKPWFGSH